MVRFTFSLPPHVLQHVSVVALGAAVLFAFSPYILLDHLDPGHCDALLNRGRWLDSVFGNWQPEGCMAHMYHPEDVANCLRDKNVVFVGDFVTRKLFFQYANLADPSLPIAPQTHALEHSDHSLHSGSGADLTFFWDPFLNSSQTDDILSPYNAPVGEPDVYRPALLVLGSGLWYLRYPETSGGLPGWESNIEAILHSISRAARNPADEVVFLPIEDVTSPKLSDKDAATVLASDRDAINSDLYHRIHPHTPRVEPSDSASRPVSVFKVFNDLLDSYQREDGLHFSDAMVRTQANLLLNLQCNAILRKTIPLGAACCTRYPRLSAIHTAVLGVAILWGPYYWLLSRYSASEKTDVPFVTEAQTPPLIFSGAVALIFLADRTGFWMKEQKHFDPWIFALLCVLSLAVGLATMKRAEQDLGFLNREQSDEWKGWMQVVILISHYFGASNISGINNPTRVLVASYLFMAGYGHTMFYAKKADFGFMRVAQVMLRLNLFIVILVYAMNTTYLSYYFGPLVSMWFLIIYATMAFGSRFNDRIVFLVGKILSSMALVTWFMHDASTLQACFYFLEWIFGIRWSAAEWAPHVTLDLWIVYVGMLTAVVVMKIREHRLTEHPSWPLVTKIAIGTSCLVLFWYFVFELTQPDKSAYNAWHQYISFLPVTAFAVLRNINPILRSASSDAFSFIGRCALETITIQSHLWLAADTQGILMVIPWTNRRSLNMAITTTVFVFVSYHVASATGEITSWICGDSSDKQLPTTVADVVVTSSRHDRGADYFRIEGPAPHEDEMTEMRNTQLAGLGEELAAPIRPRWMDRLAEGSNPGPGLRAWYNEKATWRPGVKTKVAAGLVIMWVLNILWPLA